MAMHNWWDVLPIIYYLKYVHLGPANAGLFHFPLQLQNN